MPSNRYPLNYTPVALGDALLLSNIVAESAVDSGAAAEQDIGACCYIKGAARVSTVMTILDLLIVNSVDLNLCANLADSVAAVTARVDHNTKDLVQIAILNANLSNSGAIRRAHDILTWLGKLSILRSRSAATDPGSVISRYNETAATHAQLHGFKRQCLLHLMSCDPAATEELVQHGRRTAGKSCFPEETFSNKKIIPGSCMSGQWKYI